MRNSTGAAISVLFLTLIISGFALFSALVSAVEYRVGEIKREDWANYEYYSHLLMKNYSNPEKPAEFRLIENLTQIGYQKIKVENAFNTFIRFLITRYSEDGEEIGTQQKSGDVRTGEGVEFYIIAGYLSSGDRIRDDEYAPKINKTISVVYANASREVNLLEFERGETKSPNVYEESAFQIHWDRRTGFVCFMNALNNVYRDEENYTVVSALFTRIVMLETNLWIPEDSGSTDLSAPIVAGLAIIGIVIAVVFIRKRH